MPTKPAAPRPTTPVANPVEPPAIFEPDWPGDRPLIASYRKFPLQCLPPYVRQFVRAHAAAETCDEAVIALPVLSALATSIGTTRRIRIKKSWTEPSILWTAVVAERGTRITGPLQAALEPLKAYERDCHRAQLMAMPQYEEDLFRHKNAMRGTARRKPAPVKPFVVRKVTSDGNVRTVTKLLEFQPQGLLVCCEELDDWLTKGARGSAAEQWAELYTGQPMFVDRPGTNRPAHLMFGAASVTGGILPEVLAKKLMKPRTPHGLHTRLLFAYPPPRQRQWSDSDVEDDVIRSYHALHRNLNTLKFEQVKLAGPVVSDTADAPQTPSQPDPSEQLLKEFAELREHLLRTYFPEEVAELMNQPDFLTALDAKVAAATKHQSKSVASDGLCPKKGSDPFRSSMERSMPNLDRGSDPFLGQSSSQGVCRVPEPGMVDLSPEAKALFGQFIDEFGWVQVDTDPELADSFVQMEGSAARLALVLHLTRWASQEPVDPNVCDLTSMEHAITLTKWFAWEAMRVHAQFAETAEQEADHRLLDWLDRRGSVASVRDLCRSNGRKYSTHELAEAALERLVQQGIGNWVKIPPGKAGGCPHTIMSLSRDATREWLEVRGITLDAADQPGDWVVPRDDADGLCRAECGEGPRADSQATSSGAAAAGEPRSGAGGMCRTVDSKGQIPNSIAKNPKDPEQAGVAAAPAS